MGEVFSRHLSDSMIERLNGLQQDTGSWWHWLVTESRGTFLTIRDGYVSVYVNGGQLMKISQQNDRLVCEVHEEYVTRIDTEETYVRLDGSPEACRVLRTPEDVIANFEKVRHRIGCFQGEERKGVGAIAGKLACVIDIEATAAPRFSGSKQAVGGKADRRKNSVDLVAVSPEGELWFIEAKHYSNSELRAIPSRQPAVAKQMERYKTQMLQPGYQQILAAYQEMAQIYGRLHGRFFDERRPALSRVTSIRADPMLLVFGFDEDQQRGRLVKVCHRLGESGIGARKCIGAPSNLTEARLFRPCPWPTECPNLRPA